MMDTVAGYLLALPAWMALLAVFALPALESSAFLGFVFPGEIALILGGVLAYQGRVPLISVVLAGVVGAVVGDSIGYAVGRRHGRRILDGSLGRWVKRDHLDRAERYLAARGGKAVLFGRFTAALRVMIPGLAGMSGLRYRTFLAFNVAGGVAWVVMSVMLGFLGGSSWHRAEHIASRIGLTVLAVVLLVVLATWVSRRRGGDLPRRLASAVVTSTPVRRARRRFPRATRWVVARFDVTGSTGLPLTVAVTVAVAAMWTFLGVTQDVASHEELALLDPRISDWVLAHRIPWLNVVAEAVTWLGAGVVTVPVLAVTGVLLARRRGSWSPLADIAVVLGAAALTHALVRELVRRPRPPVANWLVHASGWSYPSGHATQAFAAWGVLALLVAGGSRSTRVRAWVPVAALVSAVLVALSRVYLGVSWATDVVGGALLSISVLAIWTIVRLAVVTGGAGSVLRTSRPLEKPTVDE